MTKNSPTGKTCQVVDQILMTKTSLTGKTRQVVGQILITKNSPIGWSNFTYKKLANWQNSPSGRSNFNDILISILHFQSANRTLKRPNSISSQVNKQQSAKSGQVQKR